MTPRMRCGILALTIAAMAAGSCAKKDPAVVLPDEAEGVAAFRAHVDEYVALHEKLESTLPKLSKRASPQDVDQNQRALADLITSARHDAKPGYFFTPGMQSLVKRVVGEVLSGPGGKTIKASIMDENPGVPKIEINEKYPSSVPLSTMPPQMLDPLPKLKGELEYRFIGPRLTLTDTEADIILDFTDEILAP